MDWRFNAVGPWRNQDHCSYRLFLDKDGNEMEDVPHNRACFIEKKPRVQIASYWVEPHNGPAHAERNSQTGELVLTSAQIINTNERVYWNKFQHAWWYEGPKGCGSEYGKYPPSREWCDKQLERFRIKLPER